MLAALNSPGALFIDEYGPAELLPNTAFAGVADPAKPRVGKMFAEVDATCSCALGAVVAVAGEAVDGLAALIAGGFAFAGLDGVLLATAAPDGCSSLSPAFAGVASS